ncbi:MAG: alpha/beta hydrolase [Pseudobacteriovorax sp.]|nr:alpha/beta hydrolase [Pseudobacteriovorax sp.]
MPQKSYIEKTLPLYLSTLGDLSAPRTILFVHGGPGGHSAGYESLLREYQRLWSESIQWIVYDQYACGRSQGIPDKASHERNIEDIELIYQKLKEHGIAIDTLVGHSYGAWLARDYHLKYPNRIRSLILCGIDIDLAAPKNRSFLMDLLLLKQQDQKTYNSFLKGMITNSEDEVYVPWLAAKELRSKLLDSGKRSNYYWANQNSKNHYFRLIEEASVAERDDTYRKVRDTLYREDYPFSLRLTEGINDDIPVLLINGFHDVLMDGASEKTSDLPGFMFKTYWQSGHYPHIEEPERFLNDVMRFVSQKP